MNNKINRPWIRPLCEGPKPLGGCKVKPSAFLALSNMDQPVAVNNLAKVFFRQEEFDLNCEYDPETSTFIPKQSGIYTIFSSLFLLGSFESPTTIILYIFVNDAITIVDVETFQGSGLIDASGVVQLQAGDEVQVFAVLSGAPATIQPGIGTRFEGVRQF